MQTNFFHTRGGVASLVTIQYNIDVRVLCTARGDTFVHFLWLLQFFKEHEETRIDAADLTDRLRKTLIMKALSTKYGRPASHL